MWIEEFDIQNIKCFEKFSFRLGTKSKPFPWVTLLGENGGGKSTILQAIGLLLAGPEGAQKLLPRPLGWVRDLTQTGKIMANIHQGDEDPNTYGGSKKERKRFRYTFHVTGEEPVELRNKVYSEPSIVEDTNPGLRWLRENAFQSKGKGWFAAGYGAFRRLTRSSQIIVPSLNSPVRYTNFLSQFNEDEPLAAFEQWMVYLDYRLAKENEPSIKKQKDWAVEAINHMLPEGAEFDSVSSEGRILFDLNGQKVPTISLSDGYRSVLALVGDIIWRLLDAFPYSDDPFNSEGVILIDELDIHLHPIWQRDLPGFLMERFPNIQFVVATHSPIVAAGAGLNAVTYRIFSEGKKAKIEKVEGLANWDVNSILQSKAFGLVSPFSPAIQKKIDRYMELKAKPKLSQKEKNELQLELPFVKEALREKLVTDPLEEKLNSFLKEKLFVKQ